MSVEIEMIWRAVFIGVGATVVMDIWAVLLKRVFGVPSLNYGMVGRWLGHMARGRFTHDSIAQASPVAGEKAIGWGAHYLIGIVFAGVLLAIWGTDWVSEPSLFPALATGLFTVIAPFFLMQPGMGAGIAASKTPKPNVARLRSIVTHLLFGFGFYLAALVFSAFLIA